MVAAISPEMAKAEARRAHGRIIKHNQRSYELSEPMRVLPKKKLYEAALRGMTQMFEQLQNGKWSPDLRK